MLEIGWYYESKNDFEEQKKSVDYYKAGSECGDGRCSRKLGDLYCYGKGVEQSNEKAKELYLKAIEQGELRAYSNVGCVCVVEEEYDKALEYFQTGYERTDGEERAEFAYRLAQLYWNEYGVEEDYDKLFRFLQEASEGGLKEEINGMLCFCYGYGKGTEKNLKKAIECYKNVSKDDRATCSYICGDILREDNKWEEAVPYLQEAANLGQEQAMSIMDENSTDQEYLTKRSDDGSVMAMARLSLLLLNNGKGEDFARAEELSRKAYSLDKNSELVKWIYCHILTTKAHIKKEIGATDLAYNEYMEVIPVLEKLNTDELPFKATKDSMNFVYYESGQIAWADKKTEAISLLEKADSNKYPYAVALIVDIHVREHSGTVGEDASCLPYEGLERDITELKKIIGSDKFESTFQKAHANLILSSIYQLYKANDKVAYAEGYELCKKAYALEPELDKSLMDIYSQDFKNIDNNDGKKEHSPKQGINKDAVIAIGIVIFLIILIYIGLGGETGTPANISEPLMEGELDDPKDATQNDYLDEIGFGDEFSVNGEESDNTDENKVNENYIGNNNISNSNSIDAATELSSYNVSDIIIEPDNLYTVENVSNPQQLLALLNMIAYEFDHKYKYDVIEDEERVLLYLTAGLWDYYEYATDFGTYKDDELRAHSEFYGELDGIQGIPDPKNRYDYYIKYDADEIENVAIDVFNCRKNDLVKIRDNIGKEWLYYYDGYYYMAAGDGYIEALDIDIVGILTDGKLYYVFYNCWDYDYEEYLKAPEDYIAPLEKYIAVVELKEDQGQKYWSIYMTDYYMDKETIEELDEKMWKQ
ncbi:MAG: sel1 repeat family protein [Lachnospiraceae bacterium]|nr:sel1 repeat family protein [Lachnospiraceae bacterium]